MPPFVEGRYRSCRAPVLTRCSTQEEDPDQQRHRAAQPRDPQAHARGRGVPRRQERPHARDREAQVRRRQRVGLPPLPRRDAAGRGAVPDGRPIGLSESAQDT